MDQEGEEGTVGTGAFTVVSTGRNEGWGRLSSPHNAKHDHLLDPELRTK